MVDHGKVVVPCGIDGLEVGELCGQCIDRDGVAGDRGGELRSRPRVGQPWAAEPGREFVEPAHRGAAETAGDRHPGCTERRMAEKPR